MKRLLVYADFDWLKGPILVGELSYESLRGTDSYGFCFNEEWLRTQGGLFLSADLNSYSGVQYTTGDSDIFGCFSDALPDRWGRTLLNRREQILAQ
ncbi:HipA N-terminal domain-containing protein, partial [Porphyromonas endodontalis]|uniref:HipA N-terminal domain-containing protein n=1 Tax=Porphyromonas endodontalis TaxID=28124 RepID=UPI0026F2B012